MTDNFLLFVEQWEAISILTHEQRSKLLQAFYAYHGADCEMPEMDQATKVVFLLIRNRFDANRAKYQAKCEQNKANGKKGGRPKKGEEDKPRGLNDNPKEPNGFENNPDKANGFFDNPDKANGFFDNPLDADSDSVSDSETVSKRDSSLRSESSCQGSAEPDEENAVKGEQVHSELADEKKVKAKKEFSEDSEPYRLAVFMRDQLKANLPTLKEPDLQKWAHDFDVSLRNDKRMKEPRFVAQVIQWLAHDQFWRTVCQSPSKLREKFDHLTAKMELTAAKTRASPTGMSAAEKRVEQNKEAGRRAKEMLFGKKEQAHART